MVAPSPVESPRKQPLILTRHKASPDREIIPINHLNVPESTEVYQGLEFHSYCSKHLAKLWVVETIPVAEFINHKIRFMFLGL